MRLPIVTATAAILLLVLDNVTPTVGAAKQQQRYQLLRSKHKRHTHNGSHVKAQARSADTIVASPAPDLNSDQQAGDSGRGFMAKLMMFKSMLQPQQAPPPPPPPNNIIILSEPTYVTTTTPTTPTTTSTSPSTFTSPTTTSVVTNSTRSGIPTNVIYARHDKNALAGNVGLIAQGNEDIAPTITTAPYLDVNAAMPLFMNTKPVGMTTNQIPMIAQLPRPIQQGVQQQQQQQEHQHQHQQRQRQQQRRRNNRGGQLNQNKRRRRLQQQQKQMRIGADLNNRAHIRRRVRGEGAVSGKPLQRGGQRRKVAKFTNQNRIVNRKGDNDMLINDMSAIAGAGIGVGAGNNFDTNSRLQQLVNGLRHPQTPIVYNYH